jgi:hypothetical protein
VGSAIQPNSLLSLQIRRKKADRLEHLQWRSARSAYSSASPHPMAVAVRLVCRLSSLSYQYTSLASQGKGRLEPIQAEHLPHPESVSGGQESLDGEAATRKNAGVTNFGE